MEKQLVASIVFEGKISAATKLIVKNQNTYNYNVTRVSITKLY